jgi:ribonuclease T2
VIKRPRHLNVLNAVLLLLLLTSAATAPVAARHRSHSSGDEPGQFAYYLLSLSWSPAFCASSPGSEECSGPRRFGFIVHGLWPQNEQGWPEHCDFPREVPDEVVSGIADLMPARKLVYHEWSTHGTCTGLEPPDFFALVRRAYKGVVIPAQFVGPTQALDESPAAIVEAFLKANPRFPAQSVAVTCSGQGAARLREVHVCLDRDLAPRNCSADALRGSCKAPEVIIPPIR